MDINKVKDNVLEIYRLENELATMVSFEDADLLINLTKSLHFLHEFLEDVYVIHKNKTQARQPNHCL